MCNVTRRKFSRRGVEPAEAILRLVMLLNRTQIKSDDADGHGFLFCQCINKKIAYWQIGKTVLIEAFLF